MPRATRTPREFGRSPSCKGDSSVALIGWRLGGGGRYCPHTYRIAKTPCKAWDRRLPKTEELLGELNVNGVALQHEVVRVEPLASRTLTFKRELLQSESPALLHPL